MTADIATSLASWSTTEGSNSPSGSTAISTNLDDNLRMLQAVVRTLASSSTIASAGTTDLSTVNDTFITVTGATTITALGTVSAGIYKVLVFSGALTLTHNATSLILPGAASITTAAGDVALVVSLGSGNWRCVMYTKADGTPVVSGVRFNAIQSANAAGTISNADYAQVLQWCITTSSKVGLSISESTKSTGNNSILCKISTLALSDASPLVVSARGVDNLEVNEVGAVYLRSSTGSHIFFDAGDSTSGGNGSDIRMTAGDCADVGFSGGSISVTAGSGAANSDGGGITLQAGDGAGTGYSGGNITLTPGSAAGASYYGDVLLTDTSGTSVLIVDGYARHVRVGGSASPSINTGGGTNPTINGRDNAFIVTMGTGSPTSVTVDFARGFTTAPVVSAMTTLSGATLHIAAVSTTSVQITSSSAWSSGDKLHVICVEYQ